MADGSQTAIAAALPTTPTRTPLRNDPAPEPSSARHLDLHGVHNVVAAIGADPPPESQECVVTLSQSQAIPAYTWERTSPVHGRASGLFVLHLGATPQPSPMSRDPPNVLVNRRELKDALRGNPGRGRRGQGGVRRRLEDPVEDQPASNVRAQGVRGGRGRHGGGGGRSGRGVGRAPRSAGQSRKILEAPLGWEPPQILLGHRSPILLRPRIPATSGKVTAPVEGKVLIDITTTSDAAFEVEALTPPRSQREDPSNDPLPRAPIDVQFFHPGASPPDVLVRDPVYSPSEHSFVDDHAFPKTLYVTVPSETLNLDPGLVGDENGVSGMVVSRFYHHVTGTPMFQVDFGGGIGARSVRVSDSMLDVARQFRDTQRTLFANNGDNVHDGAGPSELVVEGKSDDPDWHGEYEDFQSEEASGETVSDDDAGSYMEDPLRELGLYNYDEDVSNWPFERVFADDQWQDQSITLVQNTNNFSGPEPGPTSPVASHPSHYFLRFWPPEILQRIVDETNR